MNRTKNTIGWCDYSFNPITKIEYICFSCKHKFEVVYNGWYPTRKCLKCGGVAHMQDLEASPIKGRKAPKFYKEPVAFGHDKKTGQPIAIDKKGKRIDPSETRYDLKRDLHGWKVTGKKVRSLDERGRLNI